MVPILFLTLFLIFQTLSAAPKEEIDCQKSKTQIDKYGKELFIYGDRDHLFPFRIEEVEEHCSRLHKASKGVRNYSQKCLKPFPRQILGLVINGAIKHLKKRCKSEASIFVKHSKCIQNKNVERVHKCMDKYISRLEAVTYQVSDKNQHIGHTCCIFYKFRSCVEKEAKKVCDSSDAVAYMKETIQEIAEDAIQFTCKGYEEDSGNCEKLQKLSPNRSNIAQSIVLPMVEIYTNL